ncbi:MULTISPECIES: hypothetical protein [Paenibacillus]|uniref:hypothetical protein n=1 Tax=Paenibacillus TaxID=44249 RepID=UPI0022B91891|nr:hypothetical protein [Paenibacillus caseinilyticus]MCZ8520253.1 hypothetical protein [Paenibacillus caseinilyticus]
MYNQQGFQNSFQNQIGAGFGQANSQYRGLETKYQPVGNVQSQYNQSLGQSAQSSQFGLNASSLSSSLGASSQSYSQFQSPQSYHTASYRGNQPGHDAYLRADSTQPAQSQFGLGASSLNSFGSSSQAQYSQFQSPQSYHTANYRGNQPGHDSYLREDSNQPAQNQFGMGAQSFSAPYSNSSFGLSQNQGFASSQSYNQFQSPQSYHTASYRGNQPGHDAYLRADSTQPAQSQFGLSAQSFNNRYQF